MKIQSRYLDFLDLAEERSVADLQYAQTAAAA
jgi:hypothetical protein